MGAPRGHRLLFYTTICAIAFNYLAPSSAAILEPNAWLRGCAAFNGDGAVPLCTVENDVTFASSTIHYIPGSIPVPLVLEGIGFPSVNLSNAKGLFSVAPGATLAFRRLRLIDAALEDKRQVSPATFLALRAFTFDISSGGATVVRQQPPALPQPPLSLEDVAITTRSCASLAIHQSFGCGASPSPHFTITPSELIVHSYSSTTLRARNVTLRCSGAGVPFPCWARTVSSAAEIRDALDAAADPPPIPSAQMEDDLRGTPLYLYLDRSIKLGDVDWSSNGAAAAFPPPTEQAPSCAASAAAGANSSSSTALQQPAPPSLPAPNGRRRIYSRPLVLSGGPIAAAATVVNGSMAEGHTRPAVELDMTGTDSLLLLTSSYGSRVELRNLTLVNLPLGPADQYPYALLALPLWTFVASSRAGILMSNYKGPAIVDVRGVAVELQPAELALWHRDLTAAVPEELEGSYCARGNGLLMPDDGLGSRSAGVLMSGGGLYIKLVRSVFNGFRRYEQVLLLPPRQQQQPQQVPQPQNTSGHGLSLLPSRPITSQDASLHDDNGGGGVSAAAVGAAETGSVTGVSPDQPQANIAPSSSPEQQLPALCQLLPDSDNAPVALSEVIRSDGYLTSIRLTYFPLPAVDSNSSSLDVTKNANMIICGGDVILCLDCEGRLSDSVLVSSSLRNRRVGFRYTQAQVVVKQVLLGDPQRPRLLHMSYAPATINIHSPSASLTLRQLVLSGLPPAGLHPSSAAWEDIGGGGVQGYGDGGWAAKPVPATSSVGHRRRRRRLLRGSIAAAGSTSGSAGRGNDGGRSSVLHRRRSRRLAQVQMIDGIAYVLGPAAGVSATGGLAAAYTNFTSCLWPLDFDRSNAVPSLLEQPQRLPQSSGGYRVFLDSVVLLVPPGELALFAWVWAEHMAAAAAATASDSTVASSEPAISSSHTAQWDLVVSPQQQATEVLQQLQSMPLTSRLSNNNAATGGASTATLGFLTARLLEMETTRRRQAEARVLADDEDRGDDDWWTDTASKCEGNISGSGSRSRSSPVPHRVATSLTFDVFSWCGLLGRNVTLSAEPAPRGLTGAPLVNQTRKLWIRWPLDLPLRLAVKPPPLLPTLPPPPSPTRLPPSPLPPNLAENASGLEDASTETAVSAPLLPPLLPPPQRVAAEAASLWQSQATTKRSILVGAVVGGGLLCLAILGLVAVWLWQRLQLFRSMQCAFSGGKRNMADPLRGTEAACAATNTIPSLSRAAEIQDLGKSSSVMVAVSSFMHDLNRLRDQLASAATATSPAAIIGPAAEGHQIGAAVSKSHTTAAGCVAAATAGGDGPNADKGKCAEWATADDDGNSSDQWGRRICYISRGSAGMASSGDSGLYQNSTGSNAAGTMNVRGRLPQLRAVQDVEPASGQHNNAICNNSVAMAVVVRSVAAGHDIGSKGRPALPLEPAVSVTSLVRCGGSGHILDGISGTDSTGQQEQAAELVLHSELGRGAQGVVFRGLWRGLSVAVKSVLFQTGVPVASSGTTGVPAPVCSHRSPIHEAVIAASLSHPNVLATYTHQLHRMDTAEDGQRGSVEGEVWRLTLVQEMCDASSLRQCLDTGLLASCSMAAAAAAAEVATNDIAREARVASADSGRHHDCWVSLPLPRQQQPHQQQCPHGPASPAAPAAGANSSAGSMALPASGAAPPPAVALAVVLQVARGMEHLHSLGVLHGDLSSANILLQTCPKPQPPQPLQPQKLLQTSPAPTSSPRAEPEPQPPQQPPQSFWAQHMEIKGAPIGPQPRDVTEPTTQQQQQQQQQKPLSVISSNTKMCSGERALTGVKIEGVGRNGNGSSGGGGISGGKVCGGSHSVGGGGGSGGDRSSSSPVSLGWVSCCGQRYGYGYIAKVADFGLSARLEGSETHLSGECRRSSLYSAPELVQYGISTKGADVYAFAILLYEVIVGKSLPVLLQDRQLGAGLRNWLHEQHRQQQLLEHTAVASSAGGSGIPQAAWAAALPPSLLLWPDQAPRGVVSLVTDCLAADPAARPSFREICVLLQRLLGELLMPVAASSERRR